MNEFLFVDAVGHLDADLLADHLERKESRKARAARKKRMNITRYSSIAASLAVVVLCAVLAYHHEAALSNPPIGTPALPTTSTNPPITDTNPTITNTEPPVTAPSASHGIYFQGKAYSPDEKLFLTAPATEENVGEWIGYVSFDNRTESEIKAYSYIPDDGETNRIIVPYNGNYYVYKFFAYMFDGTDSWPWDVFEDVLEKTETIEIWGESLVKQGSYRAIVEKMYMRITETDDLVRFFQGLGTRYSLDEINQYAYAKFASEFKGGEIWISESGSVKGSTPATLREFWSLVRGKRRTIVFLMEDHTKITAYYYEGAGVIQSSFCYILTEDQIEQLNGLIGLK